MMKARILALLSRAIAIAPIDKIALAQQPPATSAVKTVEISPAVIDAEAGQQIKLTAIGKDASGQPTDQKPQAWFLSPFDLAGIDETGNLTFYNPGEVKVGVVMGGKTAYTKIIVKPARVTRIDIARPAVPLVAGGALKLSATARTSNGNPRDDVTLGWASDTPSIAAVDAAGLVTGVAPGKATLRARSEAVSGAITIDVVKNSIQSLAIEPRSTRAR